MQNGDSYFGSWFYAGALDVMVLASQYLIKRRKNMPDFKLKSVAKELGIEVDETKLHDAEYDIYLTRAVYMIVTGLEIEY
jgi:DNA polymerase-3 subunit epsilon